MCTTLLFSVRIVTSRFWRVWLRSRGVQRYGPGCWAALRRPALPVPRAEFANSCLDPLPGTIHCVAGCPCPTFAPRLWIAAVRGGAAHDNVISPCSLPPRVARASRSGHAACRHAARVVAPCRGAQSFPRCWVDSQTLLHSLPATPRCPARRPRPTFSSRPSPAASLGVVAHDDVCSLRLALVLWGAMMRPALLRHAAASNPARAAGPIRTPVSRFPASSARLPGRRPVARPAALATRRPRRHRALLRTTM